MSTEELRALVSRLQTPANALAALGSALDAHLAGAAPDAAAAKVLAALHAPDVSAVPEADLRSIAGEIRTSAMTNARLRPGWEHTDRDLLIAAGDVSATVPRNLLHVPGVAEALARPGAAFLDVGVGVAALSIEMARLCPELRVVGIDPWEPALELARQRVRAAGLDDRVELRPQAGEALRDESAFDVVWVPSLFVPPAAFPALLARVRVALRPGGFVVLPVASPFAEPLGLALAELRATRFGGGLLSVARLEELARELGFGAVTARLAPPGAATVLAVVSHSRC